MTTAPASKSRSIIRSRKVLGCSPLRFAIWTRSSKPNRAPWATWILSPYRSVSDTASRAFVDPRRTEAGRLLEKDNRNKRQAEDPVARPLERRRASFSTAWVFPSYRWIREPWMRNERSGQGVTNSDQAERLPDSKPSAKSGGNSAASTASSKTTSEFEMLAVA